MNDNKQCIEKDCSFYLNKYKVHFYRKTFIWTIFIAFALVLVTFVIIGCEYNKSREAIVTNSRLDCKEVSRQLAAMQKDSSDIKQQKIVALIQSHESKISGLLQMEEDRISLGYVILSLWAGILMIVFLVFSIYSMFKTDEMLKQGKADLEKVNDNANKAESRISELNKKLNEAINKISTKADAESQSLQSQAEETLRKVEKSSNKFMANKKDEFTAMYQKYVDEMANAQKNNQTMIDSLLKALKEASQFQSDSDSSSKNEE